VLVSRATLHTDNMATDVEMADVPEAGKAPAKEDSKVESDAPVLLDVLRSSRALITKAVEAREAKLLIGRVLRLTATVRSQLADEGLKTFLTEVLAEGSAARAFLLSVLSEEVLASIVPRASVQYLALRQYLADLTVQTWSNAFKRTLILSSSFAGYGHGCTCHDRALRAVQVKRSARGGAVLLLSPMSASSGPEEA
jgi:hypothetical protein